MTEPASAMMPVAKQSPAAVGQQLRALLADEKLWNPDEEWHTPLWKVVRRLKAFFAENVGAELAWRDIQPHIAALGGWGALVDLDEEAVYTHFVEHWAAVRVLPGVEILTAAHDMVDAHFHDFETERSRQGRPTPRYNRFVALCASLGYLVGSRRDFFLPLAQVAKLLGTDNMTVSLWRRWAKQDGFIVETKRYQFSSKGKGKATEFALVPEFALRTEALIEERRLNPKRKR